MAEPQRPSTGAPRHVGPLSAALRARRTELRLSLTAVASRAGCSPQYLSDLELGYKLPSRKLLWKLEPALELERGTLHRPDDPRPLLLTTGADAPLFACPERIDPDSPPRTPDQLHAWIEKELAVRVLRSPLLAGSAAPFDYLCHSFFEGLIPGQPEPRRAAPDCVVWANRGGGKTFTGAIATVLDMIFKPGIEVRIIGGSLEQSSRMYDYLCELLSRPGLKHMVDGRITAKQVWLHTGSRAQVLSQSERAVRGTRVQKIRCDEVDLFDRAVWEAAQLTTRSIPSRPNAPWGEWVRGSVEAFSTMNRPMGLMWEIVGEAQRQSRHTDLTVETPATSQEHLSDQGAHAASDDPHRPRRLFRWGLVDALEHCEPARSCRTCVLLGECGGRAKERTPGQAGHIRIDDAIAQKRRVSLPVWEAEMLCLRPSRKDAVLPEFDPKLHVVDEQEVKRRMAEVRRGAESPEARAARRQGRTRQLICGMDFGWRGPTVVLWALEQDGIVTVIDERHVSQVRLEDHIAAILKGEHGKPDWMGVDPAGRQGNLQSGRSNIAVMQSEGLEVKFRKLPVEEGLNLLRTRLAPAAPEPDAANTGAAPDQPGAMSAGSSPAAPAAPPPPPAPPAPAPPRLLISSRCKELIRCLVQHHYDPDKPYSLVPVKDGTDHAVDALRYLVVNLDRPHVSSNGNWTRPR